MEPRAFFPGHDRAPIALFRDGFIVPELTIGVACGARSARPVSPVQGGERLLLRGFLQARGLPPAVFLVSSSVEPRRPTPAAFSSRAAAAASCCGAGAAAACQAAVSSS